MPRTSMRFIARLCSVQEEAAQRTLSRTQLKHRMAVQSSVKLPVVPSIRMAMPLISYTSDLQTQPMHAILKHFWPKFSLR